MPSQFIIVKQSRKQSLNVSRHLVHIYTHVYLVVYEPTYLSNISYVYVLRNYFCNHYYLRNIRQEQHVYKSECTVLEFAWIFNMIFSILNRIPKLTESAPHVHFHQNVFKCFSWKYLINFFAKCLTYKTNINGVIILSIIEHAAYF